MTEREEFEALETIDEKLSAIFNSVHALHKKVNNIMATSADLEAEIQALTTAISDAATRVTAKLADLQAKIDAGAAAADLSAPIAEIANDVTNIGKIGA